MSNFTPQKRLNQFNDQQLSIKKQKLFCDACSIELDHTRKCAVEAHIKTPKHRSNLTKGASNRALDFSLDEKKDKFKRELIISFTSANIPLNKFNNKYFKKFLTDYIKVILLNK